MVPVIDPCDVLVGLRPCLPLLNVVLMLFWEVSGGISGSIHLGIIGLSPAKHVQLFETAIETPGTTVFARLMVSVNIYL